MPGQHSNILVTIYLIMQLTAYEMKKNIHDQAVLKISCIKNIRPVSLKVLYADIDINMYKIGHTIPNT